MLPTIASAAPRISPASVIIAAGLRFCVVSDQTPAVILSAVRALVREHYILYNPLFVNRIVSAGIVCIS